MNNYFSPPVRVPAAGRGMLLGMMLLAVPAFAQWNSYARSDHHDAQSPVAGQNLNQIHWHTPVDQHPQDAGGELLIHYGSPLVTAADTIIVPVKTGKTSGFSVQAHLQNTTGSILWSQSSDWILPGGGSIWTPVFGPVLTSAPRLYFPGAAGTVYFR